MDTRVVELMNRPRIPSGTPEWMLARGDLTATKIASVLECNPYQSKRDLFLDLVKPYLAESEASSSTELTARNSESCRWGTLFEPIAKHIYETQYGIPIMDVGFVKHSKHGWLGATPDGVSGLGKLLEIKCPWKRKLVGDIPYHYWVQTQIQMEVCGLDECDYFECKFTQYNDAKEFNEDDWNPKGSFLNEEDGTTIYWKLRKSRIMTIKRDHQWFAKILPKLEKFWGEVIEARSKGKMYKELSLDKCISTIYQRTRSHDLEHHYMNRNWNEWVNARFVANYIRQDPLLDWLNMYGHDKLALKHDEKDELPVYNQANFAIFQSAVMTNLNSRFNENELVVVAHNSEILSTEKANMTIECMRKGVPIIAKPVLHDVDAKISAVPLALVRHDYLPNLVKEYNSEWNDLVVNHPSPRLNTEWCYYLVDFSFCTMKINGMTDHLYEDPYSKVAKATSYLINRALGKIQGYEPQVSFVLARKLRIDNEPFTMFYRYIMINHEVNNQREKALEAIQWFKELREKGSEWTLYPPSDPRLYPNMSNKNDYPWHKAKKLVAKDIKEITLLWQCGIKHRLKAHEQEVYKWDDDRASGNFFGFKGQRALTLDAMIKINKQIANPIPTTSLQSENTKKARATRKTGGRVTKAKNTKPKATSKSKTTTEVELFNPTELTSEIQKKIHMGWQKEQGMEFFVDFEYFNQTDHKYKDIELFDPNSELIDDYIVSRSGLIYMIGVGYIDSKGEWKYRDFTIDVINDVAECEIIGDWIRFMVYVRDEMGKSDEPITIYHWSGAEFYQLRNVLEKDTELQSNIKVNESNKANARKWTVYFEENEIQFYDLMKTFQSIPIVVNGCFSFSLKDIAKNLCRHGLTPTQWSSTECIDGGAAMALAWEIYNCNDPYKFSRIMRQIRDYNEVDCRVVWEVLTFLRTKYAIENK